MIRNGDKSLVLRLAGENNLSAPIIAGLSVEDQSLLASVLSSAMRLHNIIDAYDEDHAENFAQLFDGKLFKKALILFSSEKKTSYFTYQNQMASRNLTISLQTAKMTETLAPLPDFWNVFNRKLDSSEFLLQI